MATPVIFNFYDYLKNPIADFCVSKYPSKTILTLDDVLPDIQKLRHSKWALENDKRSYIGDQLRLYLASKQDNFLYVDADCFIPDFTEILANKNCTDFIPEQGIINNGTFFYTDKNCEFNNYYLNLYETVLEKDFWMCNYAFFNKHPFKQNFQEKKSGDMNLLDTVESRHFLLNVFYRFKKQYPDLDTIHYTKNGGVKLPLVWQLEHCPKYTASITGLHYSIWFFETIYKHFPQDNLIRLFKEQMEFTYQKKLNFVEV